MVSCQGCTRQWQTQQLQKQCVRFTWRRWRWWWPCPQAACSQQGSTVRFPLLLGIGFAGEALQQQDSLACMLEQQCASCTGLWGERACVGLQQTRPGFSQALPLRLAGRDVGMRKCTVAHLGVEEVAAVLRLSWLLQQTAQSKISAFFWTPICVKQREMHQSLAGRCYKGSGPAPLYLVHRNGTWQCMWKRLEIQFCNSVTQVDQHIAA